MNFLGEENNEHPYSEKLFLINHSLEIDLWGCAKNKNGHCRDPKKGWGEATSASLLPQNRIAFRAGSYWTCPFLLVCMLGLNSPHNYRRLSLFAPSLEGWFSL